MKIRNKVAAVAIPLAVAAVAGVGLAPNALADTNCAKVTLEPFSSGYLTVRFWGGVFGGSGITGTNVFPGQSWEGCGDFRPYAYDLYNGAGTSVDTISGVSPYAGNPDHVRNGNTDPGSATNAVYRYSDIPAGYPTRVWLYKK